jgi:hypothetical protein
VLTAPSLTLIPSTACAGCLSLIARQGRRYESMPLTPGPRKSVHAGGSFLAVSMTCTFSPRESTLNALRQRFRLPFKDQLGSHC